jgi:hypothetical protein
VPPRPRAIERTSGQLWAEARRIAANIARLPGQVRPLLPLN